MRDAVILAVLGMGTVLILLFVINLMIVAIGKLFGPKETKKIENPKQGGAVSSPAAAAPVAPAASYRSRAGRGGGRLPEYLPRPGPPGGPPHPNFRGLGPGRTAGTELILEKERKRLL